MFAYMICLVVCSWKYMLYLKWRMTLFEREPQHNIWNLGHKDLETISGETNMENIKILSKL